MSDAQKALQISHQADDDRIGARQDNHPAHPPQRILSEQETQQQKLRHNGGDENDIKYLNRTLDLLDEDDDVQAVYHNWDE